MNSVIDGEILDWNVHLGSPGVEYPSYTTSLTYDFMNLHPRTFTVISFEQENVTNLATRGLFQPHKYCQEDLTIQQANSCYKKCFLNHFKVFSLIYFNCFQNFCIDWMYSQIY